MSDQSPGIGHNKAPETVDPFLERLEEQHGVLLDEIMKLELSRRHVPRRVEQDDQMAQVTAFVIRARELARAAEKSREAAKAPYLQRGNTIDDFFGSLKRMLLDGANAVESRNAAYLSAKRAAEETARRLAAEKAAADAREAQETARKALAAEAAARQRQADEEAALRAAATPAGQSEPLPANVIPLVAPNAAAETALRHATQATEAATAAASEALEKASEAAATANAALDQAETSRLTRTVAGGGAARLKTEWTYRIHDWTPLRASLGPLGLFIPPTEIEKALARVAKEKPQPREVPGVQFTQRDAVKTTALRSTKES